MQNLLKGTNIWKCSQDHQNSFLANFQTYSFYSIYSVASQSITLKINSTTYLLLILDTSFLF